jgi:enterobacterial common antigen flippase
LLARLLHREGRGEYATAVFWSQFLMYVGLFGCLELICRYANDPKIDAIQLRRSAIRVGLVTGVITMLLAMLGSLFFIPAEKRYLSGIGCLCAVSVLAQNVVLTISGVDRGTGNFRLFNFRRIFAAAALPVLIILCLPFLEMTATRVIALYVVGSFITLVICLHGVPRPLTGPRAVPTQRLLKEARPYAWSMFATDLFDRLDLMLVLWLAQLALQGDYAAMAPVVYPLVIIPNTLSLFLFNAGAKLNGGPTRRSFVKTLLGLIAVQALAVTAFWIVANPLVSFLYPEDFKGAIPLAIWLAPASAIKGLVQALEGFLRGRGRPQSTIGCRLAAATSMLVLSWLLFDKYSVQAVAMAALAAQILCFIWILIVVLREIRMPKASRVGASQRIV